MICVYIEPCSLKPCSLKKVRFLTPAKVVERLIVIYQPEFLENLARY